MAPDQDFESKLTHERHREFYAYWRSKAPAPDKLPGRQHIDPVEFPKHLPYVGLVDVVREDDSLRFRHRLAGTAIVEHAGRDPTGKWFHDIYEGEYLQRAVQVYSQVVADRAPHISHRVFPLPGREFLHYDRMILPLASDGEVVDMIVYVTVFQNQPSSDPD